MSDIAEELRAAKANDLIDVGGSKVMGLGQVPVSTSLLDRAAIEIERLRGMIETLRSVAGPVSLEGSLSSIKQDIRQGGLPFGDSDVLGKFTGEKNG